VTPVQIIVVSVITAVAVVIIIAATVGLPS